MIQRGLTPILLYFTPPLFTINFGARNFGEKFFVELIISVKFQRFTEYQLKSGHWKFPGTGRTGDDFWFHQPDEATGKWEIGYDDVRSDDSCPLYMVHEWGNKDMKGAEFRCSEPGKYQADLFRITYGMFSYTGCFKILPSPLWVFRTTPHPALNPKKVHWSSFTPPPQDSLFFSEKYYENSEKFWSALNFLNTK